MNIFEKIWNWLNGNKTTIGLVIGFLTMQEWFVGLVGQPVIDVLVWIAYTFLGVGVLHKVAKSDTTPEPNK